MQLMDIEGEIDGPARRVWSVVSDFGGLKRWNPALISCEQKGSGVDAERVFQSKVATVTERIDSLDDAGMRIGYSIVSGSTLPVRAAKLAITVRPIGASRCAVRWTLEGEPQGVSADELRAQLRTRYLGRLDDLRRYLAGA